MKHSAKLVIQPNANLLNAKKQKNANYQSVDVFSIYVIIVITEGEYGKTIKNKI